MFHIEQRPGGRWVVCYPDGSNASIAGQTYKTHAAARRAAKNMVRNTLPDDTDAPDPIEILDPETEELDDGGDPSFFLRYGSSLPVYYSSPGDDNNASD